MQNGWTDITLYPLPNDPIVFPGMMFRVDGGYSVRMYRGGR